MNLLRDPWIPLRRRSGVVETVASYQVTDRHEDDPFVAFASVRPDLDGALAQFLIGLLQTALPPERGRDWRQRLDSPPSPEALRDAFQPFAFAFELFGEGPRFLQDLTLDAEEPAEESVEKLLIEAPGENTLRQGKAHFVKGGRIEALCPACAAAALLTLQVNAPSGGQGHRTGIRGGGPLTTLVVLPESLWKTLWLNVLLPGSLEGTGKERPEDRFPWLAPTRTSNLKEGGRNTTLDDVDPLQMYWAMPRRIRLREGAGPEPEGAACSLCAGAGRPLTRTFVHRNYGVNYAGFWRHPLTPYRKAEPDALPLHGSPAGLSYRDWLGLVQNDPETKVEPARVVEALRQDPRRQNLTGVKLWAFGYDMDNMKARAWLDGRMPLLWIAPEHLDALELDARRLIGAAKDAARELVFAAKRALTDRPKEMAHDPANVGIRFWQETEAPFYEHLDKVRAILEAGGDDTAEPRRQWLSLLWDTAKCVFQTVTAVGSFEAADPRRAALAWNGLQNFFRGGKLRDRLDLPVKGKARRREESTMEGSFSRYEARGESLRTWHAGLEHDKGARARLRRAASPEEILLGGELYRFVGRLQEVKPSFHTDDPQVLCRLAALAGLAARVETDRTDLSLPAQMGTPGDRASGPPVSETRFRRLLTASSLDDRFSQLSRAIQLLGRNVNLVSLADAVFDWEANPDLRQSWANDYYLAAPTPSRGNS